MQTYDEMVDSGFKWLGAVPSEWAIMRGKFLYINKKELNRGMVESQRLALTLRGVIERYDGDSVGLNPESLESYQIFEKNDLVFKLIDLENKQTSRVGLTPKRGIMSPAYIRLTPKVRVSAKYFYYFYYSLYLTYVFNNIAGEGVRANLSAKELLELPVPVPAPEYQQKIADFLDEETAKIDNLIAKQERLLELLEEKRRATITHAVTRGLNPNVELKETNIPWLGRIPAHWSTEKIKYVAKRRDEKISTASGHKYIGLEHVESFTGKEISAEAQSEPEGLSLSYREGDVLFGKLRPYLAKVIKTTDNGICSSEFIVLSTENKILPEFLKYSLLNNRFIEEINSSTYGAKMPRANWDYIGNTYLPIPSIEEQQKITEFIGQHEQAAMKLKQKIQTQIKLLKERRTSLISHAVTGKVKV